MSQQLWQAAKLATVGELAASIAHELNNPLATVSLRVESLLAQVPAHDPRRQALQVIEREVERMGHLVANLLQFSRHSQPQISSLDVRAELDNTLALIHYHLRNCRITVVREFAPEVPIIQADRQQLRQVFLNLLTNASDAMPQGGILTLRGVWPGACCLQARPRWCWSAATPVWAFHRRICQRCWSRFSPPRRKAKAPGSDWQSVDALCRSMQGRLNCTVKSARGQQSASPCPRPTE
jgi:hypothetical protein